MNTTCKPSLKAFSIWCIFTIILGVLFHFVYDFLNKPFIIGLFFPINESIWEHLKLALLPMTIFGILYSWLNHFTKETKNTFWLKVAISILISMFIIPVAHYLYLAIFGKVPDFINIIIYIVSIIITFYYLYKNLNIENTTKFYKNNTGIIIITLLFLIFILFTIYPPRIPLFNDPITNTFGIFLL